MWKGKPMIDGNVGRIRIQIEDAASGYLVDTPEECAWIIVQLIGMTDKLMKLGKAARESVRQLFWLPRLALYYLNVALEATMAVPSNGILQDGETIPDRVNPSALDSVAADC